MHFVNAQRTSTPLPFRARGHPCFVAPLKPFQVVNERGGLRAMLTEKPKRVALQEQRTGVCFDLVLVMGDIGHGGDENFPHSPQALKSPTTLTRAAFGALTVKETPSIPPITRKCAPNLS